MKLQLIAVAAHVAAIVLCLASGGVFAPEDSPCLLAWWAPG